MISFFINQKSYKDSSSSSNSKSNLAYFQHGKLRVLLLSSLCNNQETHLRQARPHQIPGLVKTLLFFIASLNS